MVTKIKNGKIITDGKILHRKNLYITDGKILDITEEEMEADVVIDADNQYVSSGFIDIHCHGGAGFEFVDGTRESIVNACNIHLKNGTTTIYPTISAYNYSDTVKALEAVRKYGHDTEINIPGVHLEGPYFSEKQSGAQLPEFIKAPDKEEYEKLFSEYGDVISRWSYAPELDGGKEFQDFLNRNGIVGSMGHTDAQYPYVKQAYDNGCRLVTHLYSCTSTITRRDGFRVLGVVECAYLFDDMYVEIIADGCHLPPELIKLVYKLKGEDRICLVTDAIRFGGMNDVPDTDKYPYVIEDGVAKLKDKSAFAGSIATTNVLLRTCCKKADIPLESGVKMITEIPARIMGLKNKGVLRQGYDADIVIFDEDINIKKVLVNGQCV